MYQGTYKIADIPMEIRSLHPDVQTLCRDYASDEVPQLTFEITQADIEQESRFSDSERQLEGLPPYRFPDGYLETLAVYRKMAIALIDRDILLFHGSAIAVDGAAYLFTAKSGTGKSTHTRLWRQKFGSRAVMVNDDKPLIRITPDGAFVYGTPWDGKHRLSTNICVPLKALCILERSEENRIRPIRQSEALPMLFQQSYRPEDPAKMLRVMAMLDRLSSSTGLYRLGCNMDMDAADVSYAGMESGNHPLPSVSTR